MNASSYDIRKGTSVRRAYESIRAKILKLEFQPGTEIEEAHLVKMLGVSRTPVREALIRLGAEGLVTLMPNQSARVAPLDVGKLRPFFEALDICQRSVTRMAALRNSERDRGDIKDHMLRFEEAARHGDADEMNEQNLRFHASIAKAGGNPYLAQGYGTLLVEGLRIARVCFAYDVDPTDPLADHLDQTVKEHRAMYEAIQAGNAVAAEELAGKHCELFRRRIAQNVTGIGSEVAGIHATN